MSTGKEAAVPTLRYRHSFDPTPGSGALLRSGSVLCHPLLGGRPDRALVACDLIPADVKLVQKAVSDRHNENAGNGEHDQTTIQRVEASEKFASIGCRYIHWPHPAEEH